MDDLNLPWRVDYGWGDWGMPITHTIYDGNNNSVCEIYSQQPYCAGESPEVVAKYKRDKELAAHIVRCVNSHDALVRALQHLADLHESNMAEIGLAPIDSITLSNARAALAAARGEL